MFPVFSAHRAAGCSADVAEGESKRLIPQSRIWCGTYALGGWFFGPQDASLSRRTLEAALDAGLDAFDTAPVYGFGTSERLLGDVLGSRCFMAGKCGLDFDSGEPFFETLFEGRTVRVFRNYSRSAIEKQCEESLKRLRRDVIDLYQIHWPLAPSRMAEAYDALLDLRRRERIRAIGICNAGTEHLADFKRRTGEEFAAVQMRLSLVHKKSSSVLAYARKHRIPFLAYGVLGQGALTGLAREFPANDERRHLGLFSAEWQERIVSAWNSCGIEPQRRAPAALALVLSIPGVSAVLSGFRTPEQARANTAPLDFSRSELERIKSAFEELDYRGH